ncbi:MAG: MBL fold metallo-hydrolase, partial [Proteobacteria bacterium]|nr:MBL fold metallo-hydrolase [Pseudomonadota bacterium]
PVHVPGCVVKIYHVHRNAPEHVRINFNGINFPLSFDQLGGKIEFEQLKLYETKELKGINVTPFSLDHPGGCFGYRFEAGGKSAVIGVDSEFKRISQAEMGRDLPFYQNLDLLVFDAQYEINELANRFDWGHSSPTIGVDLALREGIRQMALTHHDPWSTGPKLRRMLAAAEKHLKRQIVDHSTIWNELGQPEGTKLFNAYDGLVVDLA